MGFIARVASASANCRCVCSIGDPMMASVRVVRDTSGTGWGRDAVHRARDAARPADPALTRMRSAASMATATHSRSASSAMSGRITFTPASRAFRKASARSVTSDRTTCVGMTRHVNAEVDWIRVGMCDSSAGVTGSRPGSASETGAPQSASVPDSVVLPPDGNAGV